MPAQAGTQTFKLWSSPINSCGIEILDSRLRGNDGGGFLVFPINAHHPKSRYSHKTENQKQ
ncbi:hypothetical protein COH28_06665 [Neisseria meningitidis]|nr:hypothetical protein COH28_06665 [Neisseria meningitidis]